jgi:hypothetical protein
MKFCIKLNQYKAYPWLAWMLVVSCGVDHLNGRSKNQSRDANPRQVGDDEAEAQQTAGASEGNDDATSNGPDGKAEVEQVFVKAGLRNYSQINATMSLLTGVPRTNATVAPVFNAQLTTALPTDNDIKAFLGSQQVAVFKLAVEYCDAMIKDANLSRAFFGAVVVTGTPSVVFSDQGKNAVSDAFVTKFWGKGLDALPPHDQNVTMAKGLIDALLQGKDMNNAAVTAPVLTGVCAGVLSSAPVTMY